MEDQSPALAMQLPSNVEDIAARLECLRKAGEDIATLATAAEVLFRRSKGES